jgi:hypothetical protein
VVRGRRVPRDENPSLKAGHRSHGKGRILLYGLPENAEKGVRAPAQDSTLDAGKCINIEYWEDPEFKEDIWVVFRGEPGPKADEKVQEQLWWQPEGMYAEHKNPFKNHP